METQLNSEIVKKDIKLDFKDSKYATGRRKKSIAKVWLKKGSGNIKVDIPDSMKKRYYISWGWFEDFILNSFFRTRANG